MGSIMAYNTLWPIVVGGLRFKPKRVIPRTTETPFLVF